jgi:hypothetical protein
MVLGVFSQASARSHWNFLCVVLLCCFEPQSKHVENDPDIYDHDQQAKPIWLSNQVRDFERNIHCSRCNRQPLRPGPDVPQPVGLDEAKNHVDRRHHRDLPQAHIAYAIDQIDEDSYIVVKRVDVEKFQEAFRDSPDILVPHRKYAEAGEDDDDAFCKLPGGDRTHAFDVRGVTKFRMREFRMHLGNNFAAMRWIAGFILKRGPQEVLILTQPLISTLFADTRAQFLNNLKRGFARGLALCHFERDGSNAGMPAATIAFADSG